MINNQAKNCIQEKINNYCRDMQNVNPGGGGGGGSTPYVPTDLTDPGEIWKYIVEKGREMNRT